MIVHTHSPLRPGGEQKPVAQMVKVVGFGILEPEALDGGNGGEIGIFLSLIMCVGVEQRSVTQMLDGKVISVS